MNVNITDPQGGQILIFDSIEQVFKNVPLTASLITGLEPAVTQAMNLGNGIPVFNSINNGLIKFKTIEGDSFINVTDNGTTVKLTFNNTTDALTLEGKSKEDFLLVENALEELDPIDIRNYIEVYSRDEAHNQFFEQNKSNTPETDNLYDLGSNGRRFANLYAVNVHGTVSKASLATTLEKNGAKDRQVLTWRDGQGWIPENAVASKLAYLTDVEADDVSHDSILIYNENTEMWETRHVSNIGGSGGSAENVVVSVVHEFEALEDQTTYYLFHLGAVLVFTNGVLLNKSQYDVSNNSRVVLNTPRDEGDLIKIVVLSNDAEPELGGFKANDDEFICEDGGETEFLVSHNGNVMVYANGILLSSQHYDITNTSKVVLNTPRNKFDIIRIVVLLEV